MTVNPRRLVEIVRRACDKTQERYPGYRADLQTAIAAILTLERQHRVTGTPVRRKIQDQCVALGDLLVGHDRSQEGGSEIAEEKQ